MIGIPLRMAWRNLWRQKRRTWLTVGAMVFSNALLIFSISLQLGSYDMMIDNTLQLFSGHLQLQHPRYLDDPRMRHSLPAIREKAARLRETLGSEDIAARAVGFALVSSAERSYGAQVLGVEPRHEPRVSSLPGLVTRGRFLYENSTNEIVIGAVLARNLKVSVGDELTFIGSGRDGIFAAGVVRVAGIFDSGQAELDRGLAEVSLSYFDDSFSMRGDGHVIVVRAPGLQQAESWQALIGQQIGDIDGMALRHWEALQPGLRQAIQADMTSAWFMYLVLIVLVAFSVMNTQLMAVLERTREFGTMMALGLQPGRMFRLVVLETALMGLLGLVLGVLLGFVITAYFHAVGFHYPGLEEMAARFNLPDRMYPALSAVSLLTGPLIVLAGSLLASIYPGLRLYRLLPVEAMRAV